MINWKVRLKNKNFWVALIPALAILAQAVLAVFGISADFSDLSGKLVAVVNAVFVVLAIIGVVNDPTTATLKDSTQAMEYENPKTEDSSKQ